MKALFHAAWFCAAALMWTSCQGNPRPSSIELLDVGPVFVEKRRPFYHQSPLYAKWLTDAQAEAATDEIVRTFEMPAEGWNDCITWEEYVQKTMERPPNCTDEQYEAAIREAVVNFYTKMQGPPAYLSSVHIPGLRFAKTTVPPQALTRKEQLLLKRFYPFKVLTGDQLQYWESDILVTVFSAIMRKHWKNHSQNTISSVDDLFIDTYDMRYMLDPKRRLKGAEWDRWLQMWMYEYMSPITNRAFEPWHEEFSPGNGYFCLVTEDLVKDELWSHLPETTQTKFPRDTTYFMYYRVYGEKRVIAEGFFAAYIGNEPIEREEGREHVEGLVTKRQKKPLFPTI